LQIDTGMGSRRPAHPVRGRIVETRGSKEAS
jgi:hypothetical protein